MDRQDKPAGPGQTHSHANEVGPREDVGAAGGVVYLFGGFLLACGFLLWDIERAGWGIAINSIARWVERRPQPAAGA